MKAEQIREIWDAIVFEESDKGDTAWNKVRERAVAEVVKLWEQEEQAMHEDHLKRAYDLYDGLRTALHAWLEEGPEGEEWVSPLMITLAFGRLMWDIGVALGGLELEELEDDES